MTITTQIEIDLQHTATRPVVYAKQGDTFTREVKVCLYDGGKAANINSEAPVSGDGVTAVIRFKKPDGTSGIYDELENGNPAYIIGSGDTNIITIRLAAAVTTCPGDVLVDAVILAGTKTIAIFNFIVRVEKSPTAGTVPSNDYYNYQTLAEINVAVADAQAAASRAKVSANNAQNAAEDAAEEAANAAEALASAVRSVNGQKPDSSGNVDVTGGSGTAGVTSINGQRGALTLPICGSAICGTSAGVAAKVAVLSSQNFTSVEGAILGVRFTATNTAANPTLQCASFTGPIADPTGELVAPGKITAGFHLFFRGPTAWILIGSAPDDDYLPLSGGILTGPVGGTTASMAELIARSIFRLDTKGYSKINVQNDSDENDPAVKLGDDSGGPVRVTGVKTPVQDNDAATKSYVDAKIGSGSAGEDGGYYAISVTQPSAGKMRVTLTPSKPDMPTVPAVDIDLPAGKNGNDGGYYTPVVTQVISGSMHIAFVPSDDSMPVIPPVEIPLPAGEDGEDGVSPTVSVTDITGGHRITITDASGQKTFDVMDGGGGSVDIDDTLTQSGKAADAKTVGDALKLKYGIDGGDIQAINVTSSLTTDSGINVDFNGNRLKDVGDPVENGDAVNKKTLDQAISNVAAGSTMIPDGYCSTPAATAAKLDTFITASVTDGTPVMVNFVHQNTAENPTLTVNGVTAPILGMDAQPIAPAALTAGLHAFIYYTRYPGWVMLPMQDFKPWKLLGTVDCSEASGNIEFSNLKDITEIFVQSSGVHNDNATASGYNLVVNDINVGSAAVSISNNTNQNANHQWMYAKYNGMVWMLIRSAQAVASTNVTLNNANANLPYNLVQNVGPAKKFKLDAPVSAYVAVTGTITIWVR